MRKNINYKHNYRPRLFITLFTALLFLLSATNVFAALPSSLNNYLKEHNIQRTFIFGNKDLIDDRVRWSFPNTFRVLGVFNETDAYSRNRNIVWTSGTIEYDEGNQKIPNVDTQLNIEYKKIYFATGEDYPDAIAGAPLAAKTHSPIIILPKDPTSFLMENIDSINFYTNSSNFTKYSNPGSSVKVIDEIVILGGSGAVTENVEKIFKEDLQYINPQISRIYGNNRYETATAISKRGWEKSEYAVLVTGDNYPDALASSTLAAKYNAPILLTGKDSLDASTKEELIRLKVSKVSIIGGTGVISTNVESEITSMGISVDRIWGENRYDTSIEVAKRAGDPELNGVFAVNGYDFQDALTVAPLAAANSMPLLLVPQSIGTTPEGQEKLSLKQIVNKNTAAIVSILAMDSKVETKAFGSGFIISPNGKVLTNYHVIEGAASIKVVLENHNEYYVKSVLNYSKEKDFAVLQLEDAINLPTVELGDSDSVEIADDIVAIGNPEGFNNTISTGIISGFRQNSWRKGIDFQISAPISHGSSGGALLNMYGQVIGITYGGIEDGENLNFAIPINEVKPSL